MGTHIKNSSRPQAVRAIIALLSRISDEKLIRLTHLGQLLTNDTETLRAIAKVRHYLQTPGHPARQLFRRVLDRLPVKRRIRLFETLFNGAWFVGNTLRNRAEAQLGFRPPFIMILSPTYNCNLRCKGCYTLGYGTKPELPLEVADRLLDECEQLGIYFVTILGGEPLVYPHLFTLLERHPSIFFQVYTNGTLMTRQTARRLGELGNTAVVISIEGNETETDAWRGKGVYRKIMKAFEHLNAEHLIIGTSATVTSLNVHVVSSFEFIDHMISLGYLAQMYFLYIPVNGAADFSLMANPPQRNLLRKQVIAIRDRRPMFVLDFWNDGAYVQGCIAGARRYFHVNAMGDVEPCVYTHIATDSIYEKTLAEALNSRLFRHIRSIQPHNQNHLRPCMIIDNPHVMRAVIREVSPRFTHPGAEEIYTTKKNEMDAYAERWGNLADEIWKMEYVDEEVRQGAPCTAGAAVGNP